MSYLARKYWSVLFIKYFNWSPITIGSDMVVLSSFISQSFQCSHFHFRRKL